MLLASAAIVNIAELLGWSGLYVHLKHKVTKKSLVHGPHRPKRIPIIDAKLKKMAGHPKGMAKASANRTIWVIRHFTNTRAFEYLVMGTLNEKSKLRKLLRRGRRV